MTEPTKLFVYGTLLTNHGNWRYLLAPRIGKPDTITGFTLHSLGGFPGIKLSENGESVVGEVFDITKEELPNIDRLEGYVEGGKNNTFYERIKVVTDSGELCWTYLYLGNVSTRAKIESGSWQTHVDERRSS